MSGLGRGVGLRTSARAAIYFSREVGGGRATRQPGQVRKEAALTSFGTGRRPASHFHRLGSSREARARDRPATGTRSRLPGARAEIPAGELRRPDRPGADGPHADQRFRARPHRAGLDADRRARRRQDDDRPHPRARPQLQDRGQSTRADRRPRGARRSLPRHHGRPPCRRDRDGRRLAHRHRRHPRDHRACATAGLGALQGLHHRRSAHAVDGRPSTAC